MITEPTTASSAPQHFTPEQISRLRQPVPESYIEQREGGGGQRLSYIPGWYAIHAANEIFGEACWDREVEMTQVFAGPCEKQEYDRKEGRYKPAQVYRAVYTAKVTVTVRAPSGALVRRVGHGTGDGEAKLPYGNPKDAHELASKEAETDALKRALITFGNAFGLHLYDKKHASRLVQAQVVNVTAMVRPPQEPAPQPNKSVQAQTPAPAGLRLAEFLGIYAHHSGAEDFQKRTPFVPGMDVVTWCADMVGRIANAAAPDTVYGIIAVHTADLEAVAKTHGAFAARVVQRAVERLQKIAA